MYILLKNITYLDVKPLLEMQIATVQELFDEEQLKC